MVFLTAKFLHLFLVLIALGTLEGAPWLNSEPYQSHGANAAPMSHGRQGIVIKNTDADAASTASAPGSRRGSVLVRRGSVLEELEPSRRGSAGGASVFGRRASILDDPDFTRRGSTGAPSTLARRRVSVFEDYDIARRGSTGGVSLPLQHFDVRDTSQHAQLNLQQQLNRANIKLAQMTRRAAPTTEELAGAMEQRKRAIDESMMADTGPVPRSLRERASIGNFRSMSSKLPSNHGRLGVAEVRDKSTDAIKEEKRRAFSSYISRSDSQENDDNDVGKTRAAVTSDYNSSDSDKSETKDSKSSGNKKSSLAVSTSVDLNLQASSSDKVIPAAKPTLPQTLGLAIEGNNIGYIATIQLGSKKTDFKMLIDSGSADTWVASTKCTDCGKSQQRLGPNDSSSLKTSSKKWDITYGTGDAQGVIATDTMLVAGMKLPKFSFALATSESDDFSSAPFDGLMGLAQSKLANSGEPTPIDALFDAKKVQAPVMGYNLGDVKTSKSKRDQQDGQVTFGGVDSSRFNGTLVEIDNVSKQGFYEIPIEGVSVNGKSIKKLSSGRTSILDTGTSLMVAPEADAKAVHAKIPGAKSDGNGGFTLPCDTTAILSFKFGGQEWPLLARDLIFEKLEGDSTGKTCVSTLGAGSVGQKNEWLIGAVALKRLYYATNAKANVIGLGKLRTAPS